MSALINLVLTCLLLGAATTPTHAQSLPLQSTLRGQFGSEPGQKALPSGGTFEPRIEAALQFADNLNLAVDGAEQVNAAGLELAPGFYAAYSSDRFQGAMDYSLIGRIWDESDFDDVSQRLSSNGRWIAVSDLLYVDGQASYIDSVVDPTRGLDYGGVGIFGPENLTDTTMASVAPTVRKTYGGAELLARYTYGRVWYGDVTDSGTAAAIVNADDSTDQSATFSVGTASVDQSLTGHVSYDWQRSDYELGLPFRYERVALDGAWRVTDTLQLVFDAGLESALDEDSTAGGLDSEVWHIGARWTPDQHTSAELRVGDRFFGNSYFVKISRQTRIVRFEASYIEDPTGERARVGGDGFDPGNLAPYDPGLNFEALNNSPYLSKDARVSVKAEGNRSLIGLVLYDTERDFLDELKGNETRTGGTLTATRRFASNLSGDFETSYQDYRLENFGSSDSLSSESSEYDTQVILRLNRGHSSKVTTSLEGGYFNRGGNVDYDGWWVALRARYVP